MLRAFAAVMLLALIIPLGGCVVVGPNHPGWCYNHPYRCR